MVRITVSRQRWEQLGIAAHFDARELAVLCKLSNRQLQRIFRRTFLQSPQEWLNEQRLQMAGDLLCSGLAVKAVAFELGFKQPSHFCRQFKLWHQMTPSEFVLSQLRQLKCRSGIIDVAQR